MTTPTYIYLHGFASSPQSAKAQYLRDRFAACQLALNIPDLNQGDFSRLTLTRQLQQVESLFPSPETPVVLIGSSFGGLTAAWLAQRNPQVQRIVLLAPAFSFLSHWLPKLGEPQVQQWQASGSLAVYHYGEQRSLRLHYEFVRDASLYAQENLQPAVPTLILHGREDEVIPIQASRDYAQARSFVKLIELDSDHSLGNALPEIWQAIYRFLQLPPPPAAS